MTAPRRKRRTRREMQWGVFILCSSEKWAEACAYKVCRRFNVISDFVQVRRLPLRHGGKA